MNECRKFIPTLELLQESPIPWFPESQRNENLRGIGIPINKWKLMYYHHPREIHDSLLEMKLTKWFQSLVIRIDSNKIISLTLQDVLWTYINIRCLWIPPPNVCNQATIVAQLWRYHHIFRFPAKKILEKMHKFHNKVNKSSKGCFRQKKIAIVPH